MRYISCRQQIDGSCVLSQLTTLFLFYWRIKTIGFQTYHWKVCINWMKLRTWSLPGLVEKAFIVDMRKKADRVICKSPDWTGPWEEGEGQEEKNRRDRGKRRRRTKRTKRMCGRKGRVLYEREAGGRKAKLERFRVGAEWEEQRGATVEWAWWPGCSLYVDRHHS